MSGYFSTDLVGTNYTVETYWVVFAIVFVLSWVALVGFGVISGTMESWAFFPALRRLGSRLMRRLKREKHE